MLTAESSTPPAIWHLHLFCKCPTSIGLKAKSVFVSLVKRISAKQNYPTRGNE